MPGHREPLDTRKQLILKAVVHEHVETAEPVGSGALVVHYSFGVGSATIRNEMAEMAEMGYLRQPHTSAGRVPSDLGYRFFVDKLMDTPLLPRREVRLARETLLANPDELDRIIARTCRILTALTHCASIATHPAAADTLIRHVGLSKIDTRRLLLVVVLSDGRVEHRILDPGGPVSDTEAEQVRIMLSSAFLGQRISSITSAADTPAAEEPVMGIAREAIFVLQQVAESLSGQEADVCVEGTNYILKQPEFQDIARIEALLALVEQKKALYQLLSRTVRGPLASVLIGRENPLSQMHDTSFVGASYSIGDRAVGTIGVVGPTRMDYRRAIAAVEAMARNLSDVLTTLSLNQ